MDIVEYQPHYLPELTDFYNDLVRVVPHCYPVQAEELEKAFAGQCGYEAYGERMKREAVFVAVDREVVGFIHAGEGVVRHDDATPQGAIRFLAYPRGRRGAGQALLDRAESWLRSCGLESVLVYRQAYRYPFYHFSHAYLSNHLEHIQALLLFNGYELCGGEIYLDWPDMKPGVPHSISDFDVELKVTQVSGPGRLPDLKVKAFHEDQEIGECFSISARAFSNREVVEEWIFTQWLGVTEPFQGKGLGRYLLGRSLVEARKAGYRHAAISTALNNHRALLFYANFGYRTVDWTRQFRRRLS